MGTFPKVEYVLFDLDGLIVDSERIYTEVTNSILASYGKTMTWYIKAQLMGKPDREAAAHLLSFFPDIPLSMDTYLTERNAAQDLLWPTVPLLPGARKLVCHLHAHRIPIALASGSHRAKYELKAAHLQDVFSCFAGHVVCGDDTDPTTGTHIRAKPSPDVFLVAAREALDRSVGRGDASACSEEERVERAKGLVFEDALPGVQAGKRAGMSVVWVPDPNLLNVEHRVDERADQILSSLEHFVPEQWGLPPYDSNLGAA